MTGRNVDIQPTDLYEAVQDDAANAFVHTQSYGGSAEALALKQLFVAGANTALQFSPGALPLLAALAAGRKWGLAVSETVGDRDPKDEQHDEFMYELAHEEQQDNYDNEEDENDGS